MPKNRTTLLESGILSEKQFHRHGVELLEVFRRSANLPLPKRKTIHRPSVTYLTRYEKLKRWRAATAAEMELESDVILPKDIMRRIAELHEISKASLKEVMHSTPWRFKEYAPRILEDPDRRVREGE